VAKQTDYTDLGHVALVMEPSSSLRGRSFAITGHLGLKRDEIVKIIETAGGTFEPRPRYGTSFLICNFDWNKGSTVEAKKSSKLLEAERNDIKVISEADFYKMVVDGDDSTKVNLIG
jgi:NAD-dependent DNA ligase